MVQQRGFRQRNGRRAWAWPRPQNWFKVLLANRDMDSLWKTPAVHFESFYLSWQVVLSFHQNRDNAARRFRLASIS